MYIAILPQGCALCNRLDLSGGIKNLLHVVFAWWVHKGMVYDILQQFFWLGVVSVVSLVTVALTDLFWVRMGLLAAGLGVCALWAARHRDQVMKLVAVFRKKSA